MDALDSSVCIPALADWHPDHDQVRPFLPGAVIPAHALIETYSVLTRLPGDLRVGRRLAREVLDARFPASKVLVAPATLQRSIMGLLDDAGISGGATYDGLIGLTAAHHGATLLTRDARAVKTYEALGIAYRLL